MPKSIVPLLGYLVAGGLFTLGNSLCAITFPWLVYDLTGSATKMGMVAFVTIAPAILGALFGGVLVDRYSTRKIALISTVFNLLPMAIIAWLATAQSLTFPMLLPLVFLASSLDGFGQIAFEARWPEVTRMANMSLFKANAIDDMIDNLIMVTGPVMAGLSIYFFGTTSLLWLVTAVSAAGFLVTFFTFPNFRKINVTVNWRYMQGGVEFLLRSAFLRTTLILGAVAIGVWVALEAVIIPAALRDEGQSAKDFGAYLAAGGLGAILINVFLVIKNITPPIRRLYVFAFGVFALSLFVLSYDRSFITLILSSFISGLAVGPLTPAFNTVLLNQTPKILRARVSGASGALALSLSPLGALVAGGGVEHLGAQYSLLACGALISVCAFWACFIPVPEEDKHCAASASAFTHHNNK